MSRLSILSMLSRWTAVVALAGAAAAPMSKGADDPAKPGTAAPEPAKATAPGGDLFDPKGYIDQQETKAAEASSSLSARAIYRINGQRYQMFQAGEAAVWLPSSGSVPEIRKESALCEVHLKLMQEVLPLREELPVDPEIKKHEPEIVDLIRMCREGLIKSPVLTEVKADGAVVEIKAKEKTDSTPTGPGAGRPAEVEATFKAPSSGGGESGK